MGVENHLLTLLGRLNPIRIEPHMRTITVEQDAVLRGPSSGSNWPASRNPPSFRSSDGLNGAECQSSIVRARECSVPLRFTAL